jgi:hypothetical protein
MSTSGTNTFTQVKNQIIELAYSRAGILSDENSLTAFQIERGSTLLNIMIKNWIIEGVRLWKQAKGTLFLERGQASYNLNGSSANATEDYDETETTADALSGATTIPVADTTGFVVGYNIGVMQDNGSIHWTTIANIASLVITLDDPLTYDTVSGSDVFVYQTKINRPENIINAQCQISNGIQIAMQLLARDTYDAIALKDQQGIPTQLYYNKQLSFGEIKVFQTPSSEIYKILFTFQKQFFDMTNPTTDFDFPTEWLKPLYTNLAKILIGFNSVKDPQFIADLKEEATTDLALVKGFDDDLESIYFYPASDDNRGTYL